MNRKISSIFIFVAFTMIFLTGCAAFRSDIKGKFGGAASKNYEAEKVSVLFIFRHVRQTLGYDAIPKLENQRQRLDGFDDIFNDALREISNIKEYSTFTEYASDVNKPQRRAVKDSLITHHDYVMNITFSKEKSFAKHFLGTLVSSVTATLAPVPYSRSFTVKADVFNSKNVLVKSYKRKASLSKWVQTFLIFLYPFHPEKRKTEEIYVAFLHDIFRQIETEKILVKQ